MEHPLEEKIWEEWGTEKDGWRKRREQFPRRARRRGVKGHLGRRASRIHIPEGFSLSTKAPAFTWRTGRNRNLELNRFREEKHMSDNGSTARRGDTPGWGQSAQDGARLG